MVSHSDMIRVQQRTSIFITAVLVGLLFMVTTAPAFAQSAYQPRTQEQQIAYLFGVLAQLQLQLAQLQAAQAYQRSSYTYEEQSRYSSGSVQNSGLAIATERPVRIDEDSAVLRADVDLGRSNTAEVWFEYGRSSGLTERTTRERVTRDGLYERRLTNLREDTRYSFRAVVRDAYGNTRYGLIRQFTTDDDRDRYDDDDYYGDIDVVTDYAEAVSTQRATLTGSLDTNDVENVTVFFVYGRDSTAVDRARDEDRLRDINLTNLRTVVVENRFDGRARFTRTVSGLAEDRRYYFTLCVEYFSNGYRLACGSIESFVTKR